MLTFLLVAGEPAAEEPPDAIVAPGYDVTHAEYPPEDGETPRFAVCGPGLPLVTHDGGVLLAGVMGWVVEPGDVPVHDFSCTGDGTMYLVRGMRLTRRSKSDEKSNAGTLALLPAGDIRIAAGADGVVWIWGSVGEGDDKKYVLRRWDEENGLVDVWSGTRELTAVAPLKHEAVATCIDKNLLLWRRGKEPQIIAKTERPCAGLAPAGGGSLFVSTRDRGILKIDASGEVGILTMGPSGPLRVRGGRLYLLWRKKNVVLELVGTKQ